jgi:hypothetical protein
VKELRFVMFSKRIASVILAAVRRNVVVPRIVAAITVATELY